MSRQSSHNYRIAVIGAGVFGTALARMLAENNPASSVDIWSYEKSVSVQINSEHINSKYLPEIKLPDNINSSASLRTVVENADVMFLTTPAKFAAEIMETVCESVKQSALFVICTKGMTLFKNEYSPVFSAAEKILGSKTDIAVVSGPSHVEELMEHRYTRWIYAAKNADATFDIADQILSNSFLAIKKSSNPLGTELGGILKNVAAILFGIIGSMPGSGENLMGILFSECTREMHEVMTFYGAGTEELLSESGVGDLAATCFSRRSRNRNFGEQVFLRFNTVFKRKFMLYRIFRSIFPRNIQEPRLTVRFYAEGAFTVKPLVKIANMNGLRIPLFRALFDVLSSKKTIDFLYSVAKDPDSYFSRSGRNRGDEISSERGNFLTKFFKRIFRILFRRK